MPTITTSLADLRTLSGIHDVSLDRLRELLDLVKGELKRGSTEDALRIELKDTNRPDTWCVEGIARQLRFRHASDTPRPWRQGYAFFEDDASDTPLALEVDASVEKVRPFLQAFVADGWRVDDAGLVAFIEAQETLSRNYGKQRREVSIGIYDASRIAWPIRYETVPLDDRKRAFVPLTPQGEDPARWSAPLSPREILERHPTGREYAPALDGSPLAPILVDAKGNVLSFPPIINSAGLGRVVPGMDRLLVEVTGRSIDQVLLASNILAANMKDRGATIHPCVTRYPFPALDGAREVRAPHRLRERRLRERVPVESFARLLGETDSAFFRTNLLLHLRHFGLEAESDGRDTIRVEAPPWRQDYLHDVDAIEDFAVSRGYALFDPLMPEEFTVGRLDARTELEDVARDRLIGFAFEEAIGNILTSDELVRARMDSAFSGLSPEERRTRTALERGLAPFHGGKLVRIQNIMNASYSVLRDWLLPTLLEVEARSAGAAYPHRVFEAGEVAVFDAGAAHGSRTERRVGALVAHEGATFSEAQAYLHALLRFLGVAPKVSGGAGPFYVLDPIGDHPSFIPGRAAVALGQRGQGAAVPLAFLGEVHPAVLEAWGVRVPAAAFELSLDALACLRGAREEA